MRQNDDDVRAVHARLRDIPRHALRLHQRNHAPAVALRAFAPLVAQPVCVGQHGHLHPADVEHRRARVHPVRVHARVAHRAAGQLAGGDIQSVVALIQRAFRRQRHKVHADGAQRVEKLGRRVVIAVALFPPGQRGFQRHDGEIRARQRAGKPLERRREVIVIHALLRALANGLRRVNRARGGDGDGLGRLIRRGGRRRLDRRLGGRLKERRFRRRNGRLGGLALRRLFGQIAEYRARPLVDVIPRDQAQKRRHADDDKGRHQHHHDAADRKPRLFHGVPLLSSRRPRIVQNWFFASFYSIHQNTDFEKTEKQAVTPNARSRGRFYAIFHISIIEQKANSAQKTWAHTARLIA